MSRIFLLGGVLFLAGTLMAFADAGMDVSMETLKTGKGLVEENCIECHELDWPWEKVTDRAGWDETLNQMAGKGAIFGQEDREMILSYLLVKSTFQKNCVECHSEDRSLKMKMSYEEWLETVEKEVARKPGMLGKEDIASVARFLTLGW